MNFPLVKKNFEKVIPILLPASLKTFSQSPMSPKMALNSAEFIIPCLNPLMKSVSGPPAILDNALFSLSIDFATFSIASSGVTFCAASSAASAKSPKPSSSEDIERPAFNSSTGIPPIESESIFSSCLERSATDFPVSSKDLRSISILSAGFSAFIIPITSTFIPNASASFPAF